jgi:hypothetical protein
VRSVETTVTMAGEDLGKYRISEAVRSMQSQDGAVLLDVREGRMFSVNRVGSRVLEAMKSCASESEIAEMISEEFEVCRATAEKDVREFLAMLAQHKLVQASGGDDAAATARRA